MSTITVYLALSLVYFYCLVDEAVPSIAQADPNIVYTRAISAEFESTERRLLEVGRPVRLAQSADM